MKFGCCIKRKEDVLTLARLGYDFYEYSGTEIGRMSRGEFDELLAVTDTAKIACLGFNSYSPGRPAIVGEAFSREETEDYAGLLCARGRELGISNVGIGAPAARRLPADYPREKADRQCLEFLRITAAEAARYGQRLLFEAVHSGVCDYGNHTRQALEIVERAALPNLALVLDFYHMKMMGEGLSEAEGVEPYLGHVHVSTREEGLGRGFPHARDEAEYREIFSWLRCHGYKGTVSIEAGSFEEGAAASSLELLRKLDAGMGEQGHDR